ncbi:MAG: beta-lactamase family protein [Sphingomonas sp.]|nr:beta-lactamase family protein [Sphingomonas sp.]
MSCLANVALASAALAILPAAAPPPAAASMEDRLGHCFDQQSAKVPFSGIVAASDGTARFERAAGFADAAGTRRPTSDAPFRLASVQKVLTQIAIAQLVDARKLDLAAPVGRYLGGLPPQLAAVTIDQLLHHQSGVASLTMLNPEIAQVLISARSARDLVPLVAAQPLAFAPGSRTEYSNGGYFLLGAVIEATSGQSYGDYLQSHVFRPLDMTHSSLTPDGKAVIRYTRMSPAGLAETPRPVTAGLPDLPASAAGDGLSSASDMLALGRALVGDKLVSKTTKERIFQQKSSPWRIGQSGGSIGTNTDFAVFPESGWVVVTLSNYDPPAGELMGEVMSKMATTGTCQPLGAEDRPSPFRMITPPPARQP